MLLPLGEPLPRRDAFDSPSSGDDLTASFGFGLEENRIHVGDGFDAACLGLEGLSASDFASVGEGGGVGRHVLRLEGDDSESSPRERPTQSRDEQRLSDVGSRSLHHESAGDHGESSSSREMTWA